MTDWPGTTAWHAKRAREWREGMMRPESFKAKLWRLVDRFDYSR